MKKKVEKKWEDELYEKFKEDIEVYGQDLSYFLDLYPTREFWDEMEKEIEIYDKNSKILEELREKFVDDNEFDQFIALATKNPSLLDSYISKSDLTSFKEHLKKDMTRSSGGKKLINYFIDLTSKKEFRDEVLRIREKAGIPKEGYPFSEEDYKQVLDKYSDIAEGYELARKFGLYSYRWQSFFVSFLFFGNAYLKKVPYRMLDFELCKIVDEKSRNEEKWDKDEMGFETEEEFEAHREAYIGFRKDEDAEFPIAIKISPYASGRDIADFIARNSKWISELQNRHRLDTIGIGKIKKKNSRVQERNEFIFEIHRVGDKFTPYQKIQRMVYEKFGETLDLSYIAKIIATERKKRKKL